MPQAWRRRRHPVPHASTSLLILWFELDHDQTMGKSPVVLVANWTRPWSTSINRLSAWIHRSPRSLASRGQQETPTETSKPPGWLRLTHAAPPFPPSRRPPARRPLPLGTWRAGWRTELMGSQRMLQFRGRQVKQACCPWSLDCRSSQGSSHRPGSMHVQWWPEHGGTLMEYRKIMAKPNSCSDPTS